jgi:hypothetical protein
MPPLTSSPRFSVYALAGAVLGAALFSAHVWAASNAPMPDIRLDVKRTQTKPTTTNASDSDNNDGGGKGGSKKGAGVNSRNYEIYYIVTLHNDSNFAATNVEVDYSIYNRTRTTTKGQTTTTYDPQTGTETVDIPANSSKDVETSKVAHTEQTAAPSNGKKKGGNSNPTTINQDIAGVWVEAKIGDNVLQTYEDPMDIKQKMDEKAKQSGQ